LFCFAPCANISQAKYKGDDGKIVYVHEYGDGKKTNCEYEGVIFPFVWAARNDPVKWRSIARAIRPGFALDFGPCNFDQWIWHTKAGGMPNIFGLILAYDTV
jgi:hypothetical protein